MQHIGQGAIPRLVTVTEYIAPTSRELQDWVVETEVHIYYNCKRLQRAKLAYIVVSMARFFPSFRFIFTVSSYNLSLSTESSKVACPTTKYCRTASIELHVIYTIQWNLLQTMDTLGTSVFVHYSEVVPSSEVLTCIRLLAGGTQFVHCREVVRSSECPLSEVPLYTHTVYTYTLLCVYVCVE